MLATVGNFHRYRAHRKRNKTRQRSRCGQIQRYEQRHSSRPSDDHKAKDHNKGRQGSQQIHNCRAKGKMARDKSSSLVQATITASVVKVELASSLAEPNHRPRTSRNSRRWVALQERLAQIEEQD
jgi:hypothetical protein